MEDAILLWRRAAFSTPRKRKEHIMRKIVRENPNLVLIIVGHTFYQGTK